MQAQNDEILSNHLMYADYNTKYTSAEIQNELISICGELIKEDVVKSCNKATFFGFIADEATDESKKEQMSLYLRYAIYRLNMHFSIGITYLKQHII